MGAGVCLQGYWGGEIWGIAVVCRCLAFPVAFFLSDSCHCGNTVTVVTLKKYKPNFFMVKRTGVFYAFFLCIRLNPLKNFLEKIV